MLKRDDLEQEYFDACHRGQFDRANSIQLNMHLLQTGNSWKLDDGLKYDDSVFRKDGYVTTKEYGGSEVIIANCLSNNQSYFSPCDISKSFNLGEEQEHALRGMTGCKYACLQGPPGSGKTKTIEALYRSLPGKTLIAAPTGVAAKRITESTGINAVTCHRLLGYKGGEFFYNYFNKLDTDNLFIDESSMGGVDIIAKVFDAIPQRTRVYFIGDVNQLPSVTPGNFFADAQKILPTFKLTKIYRFDNDGAIGEACRTIIEGGSIYDIENIEVSKGHGVYCRDYPWHRSKTWIKNSISHMYFCLGERPYNIRVCAPDNKTVWSLNQYLEAALKDESDYSPYMQTRNDYDLDIFNGEIGLSNDGGKIIDFGGSRITECTYSMKLSWVCTVHKLQGCQCKGLVIALPPRSCGMMDRNLFYTALSRSSQMAFVCGDLRTMDAALARKRPTRLTRLWALGKR